MNRLLFLVLVTLALFVPAIAADASILPLMPVPQQMTIGSGKFRLDASFSISVDGGGDRLRAYAQRILLRISRHTALFLSRPEVGTRAAPEAAVRVRCRTIAPLTPVMDESYRLQISPQSLLIEAETDIGAMRGLETAWQLVCADEGGFYFPEISIQDHPRFPWRGLLIDVSRHFLPVDAIKRNLDGMAMVKLNVLHWHLCDNQGFRVESKRFPRLHGLGSDSLYYTQEQIGEVIRYASDRGIRVVPEFDIPGHSTSWLVGYGELGSGNNPYSLERAWGVFDPAFNPANPKVYRFFDRFFGEMAGLFSDEYIHIGGDEVNGKEWEANSGIKAFMARYNLADHQALQAYFNNRIAVILKKNGKKMIGWDEIYQPGLDRETVIHSWRGREALIESARKGFRTILSNGYYIDLMQSVVFHYRNDPLPAGSGLTPEQERNILGGEATMWAEMVTDETVDSRIWPRTAAIAERLWSPREQVDVESMLGRLDPVSRQLDEVGLTHQRNRGLLLRRLARGGDTDPLQTLLDVVEPVEEYRRHDLGKIYTAFSPLTRLVDTACADAPGGRTMAILVSRFLEKREASFAEAISERLNRWLANHDRLKAMLPAAPTLREIESLSSQLSDTARIGLQALHLLRTGEKAEVGWLEQSRQRLLPEPAPASELELVILQPLQFLLDAVPARTRKDKEE